MCEGMKYNRQSRDSSAATVDFRLYAARALGLEYVTVASTPDILASEPILLEEYADPEQTAMACTLCRCTDQTRAR